MEVNAYLALAFKKVFAALIVLSLYQNTGAKGSGQHRLI